MVGSAPTDGAHAFQPCPLRSLRSSKLSTVAVVYSAHATSMVSRTWAFSWARGGTRSTLSRLCALTISCYARRPHARVSDWASMCQKDPELFDANETPEAQLDSERAAFLEDLKAGRKFYGGERYELSRSHEQKAAFRRALHESMDLWYGHACITVVLLTLLPEGVDVKRNYESRGWVATPRLQPVTSDSSEYSSRFTRLVIGPFCGLSVHRQRLSVAQRNLARSFICNRPSGS
jgi:hypothetical protein